MAQVKIETANEYGIRQVVIDGDPDFPRGAVVCCPSIASAWAVAKSAKSGRKEDLLEIRNAAPGGNRMLPADDLRR